MSACSSDCRATSNRFRPMASLAFSVSAGTRSGSRSNAFSISSKHSGNFFATNRELARSRKRSPGRRSRGDWRAHRKRRPGEATLAGLGERRHQTQQKRCDHFASASSTSTTRSAPTPASSCVRPPGQRTSTRLAPGVWPEPEAHQRLARRGVADAGGGVVVKSAAVRQRHAGPRRPGPCRLLRTPRSFTASQCRRGRSRCGTASRGRSSADTTTSTRPSLSKSAKAAPWCRAALKSGPAWDTSSKRARRCCGTRGWAARRRGPGSARGGESARGRRRGPSSRRCRSRRRPGSTR